MTKVSDLAFSMVMGEIGYLAFGVGMYRSRKVRQRLFYGAKVVVEGVQPVGLPFYKYMYKSSLLI